MDVGIFDHFPGDAFLFHYQLRCQLLWKRHDNVPEPKLFCLDIHTHIKERKATNPHVWEAGNVNVILA